MTPNPPSPADTAATDATAPTAPATPADPDTQRRELLDAQRRANQNQPRNFKQDALDEKVVHMEPDNTGPTPTENFDPAEDRHSGEARATGSPESPTEKGLDTTAREHPSER